MLNLVQLKTLDDMLNYIAGYAAGRKWTFNWDIAGRIGNVYLYRFEFKDKYSTDTRVRVTADIDLALNLHNNTVRKVLLEVEREMARNVIVL